MRFLNGIILTSGKYFGFENHVHGALCFLPLPGKGNGWDNWEQGIFIQVLFAVVAGEIIVIRISPVIQIVQANINSSF